MNPELTQAVPEQWRGLIQLVFLPISWLFPFQKILLQAAWSADFVGLALFKRIFLLLPALSVVVGLWCTMLGIYTLLFRWGRVQFIGTLLILWWDIARCSWLFWAGVGRFLWVAFGSLWGLLRLIVEVLLEIVREAFELPFVLTGMITHNLRQPGVPWIASLMTVAWSALEALVFTYVLSPTMSEILSDLTGTESHRFLGVFLFCMLFTMVAGSLACMYVLVDSIAKKDFKQILQMFIVEFVVMFVEVLFLYRELVDALTPWIAQQTGVQMGLVPVLLISAFSWLGIRGMVWFLFARFGTPTLLAVISRQRLPEEAAAAASASAEMTEERWQKVLGKLKKEQLWFQEKAQELLEAAILPSFQVIAAGLNFCIALFLSKPLFNLPFKNLAEVGETKVLLQSIAALRESP